MFVFGGLDGERLNDLYAIKIDVQAARNLRPSQNTGGNSTRTVEEVEATKNNFKNARKNSELTSKEDPVAVVCKISSSLPASRKATS